jgi:hypothetical protein
MDNLREKLLELIAKAKEIYACDYTDRTEDEYIAETLLDNGVTVQEWISVKDRLPEDDLPKDTDRKQIRCLVATDKGTVKSCVRQRYQTKKNGQGCLSPWEWNKDLFAKPTHWMPPPAPPKGE